MTYVKIAMEFRGFYKNASRGNRLKDGNNQLLRSKRESSRQDLHCNNRNLNASDAENDHDEVFHRDIVKPRLSGSGKKRRRSRRKGDDKENEYMSKYQQRLARLKKFKEERANAKQNTVKKKPFVSVVSKNNLVDKEYEKNLFKKSEEELKRLAEKRKLLTPAAKNATPRVDTRRKDPVTSEKKRSRRNILAVKTPVSIKQAKPKVDTWRKGITPMPAEKKEPRRAGGTGTVPKVKNVTATKTSKATAPATTVMYKKGDAATAGCSGNMVI